jgi:serine/threonine protein kinase
MANVGPDVNSENFDLEPNMNVGNWRQVRVANNRGNWKGLSPDGLATNLVMPAGVLPPPKNNSKRPTAPSRRNRPVANRRTQKVFAPIRFGSLCKRDITEKIHDEKARLTRIGFFSKGRGEGSFGSVQTAEMTMDPTVTPSARPFRCLGILKTSKQARANAASQGIPFGNVREISAGAKLRGVEGIAMPLYFSIDSTSAKITMEHYLSDLFFLTGAAGPETDDISQSINFFLHQASYLSYVRPTYSRFILAIIFQVCKALAEIHERGFIHRDIKEENVFVSESGEIKIGDFGLCIYNPALKGEDYSKLYGSWGTPSYMPPESYLKRGGWQGLNANFDTWSVGVMAARLLLQVDYFDFSSIGANWKARIKVIDYITRQRATISKLWEIYGDRSLISFMESILMVDGESRLQMKDVLRDPIFRGMTLESSKKIVKEMLSKFPIYTRYNSSIVGQKYINMITSTFQKIFKQTRNARRPTAPANAVERKNIDPLLFTRVVPSESEEWQPGPNPFTEEIDFLTKFVLDRKYRLPFYSWLHTIELFHRYHATLGGAVPPEAIRLITAACMTLSQKVNPHENLVHNEIQYKDLPEFAPGQLAAAELEILKRLGGDVLPKQKGLLSIFTLTQAFLDDPAIIPRYTALVLLALPTWKGGAETFEAFLEAIAQAARADNPIFTRLEQLRGTAGPRLETLPVLSNILFHSEESVSEMKEFISVLGLPEKPPKYTDGDMIPGFVRNMKAEFNSTIH